MNMQSIRNGKKAGEDTRLVAGSDSNRNAKRKVKRKRSLFDKDDDKISANIVIPGVTKSPDSKREYYSTAKRKGNKV